VPVLPAWVKAVTLGLLLFQIEVVMSTSSSTPPASVRVLFVCLGNICRSPTAEGIFRDLLKREGLDGVVAVDSCGTGGWHRGDPPDPRAQAEARRRGIDISGLRGRQVAPSDFRSFDYILAMDRENYDDLIALCPAELRGRVHMALSFAPQCGEKDVPDPYYGGPGGFAHVYDLLTAASEGLLAAIRRDGRR